MREGEKTVKYIEVADIEKESLSLDGDQFMQMRGTMRAAFDRLIMDMIVKRAEAGAMTLKISVEALQRPFGIMLDGEEQGGAAAMLIDWQVSTAITEKTNDKGKAVNYSSAVAVVDGEIVTMKAEELDGQTAMELNV